jgi:glycopeptide antibiotics resistance protein
MSRKKCAAAIVLVTSGLALIIGATLWPLAFKFQPLAWRDFVRSFDWTPSSPLDFPLNILLYLPFGGGVSLLLRRCAEPTKGIGLTLLASGGVTACVEAFQVFQPARTPNLSDMLANTTGGLAGMGCVLLWERRRRLPAFAASHLTLRCLGLLYGSGLLMALLFAAALTRGMAPGGWDPTYRMALGNEITGDRPWAGLVRDVLVLSRAVTEAEAAALLKGDVPEAVRAAAVAEYPLKDATGLSDRGGQLPVLTSIGGRTARFLETGTALNESSWIATEIPVYFLTETVNASRQFAVALTVTPERLEQDGPARIFTISTDPFDRNLTIGQRGTGLVVRWRSFLTADNGSSPEVLFSDVFRPQTQQRLVISCDGVRIGLYRTGPVSSTHVLGPEVAFMAALKDNRDWLLRLDSPTLWVGVPWAACTLLPLGFIAGTASRMLRLGSVWYLIGSVLAIGVPSVVFETAFALQYGLELRVSILVLGVSVTAFGYIVARLLPIRLPQGVSPPAAARLG